MATASSRFVSVSPEFLNRDDFMNAVLPWAEESA